VHRMGLEGSVGPSTAARSPRHWALRSRTVV
jgi:hypothetical protein